MEENERPRGKDFLTVMCKMDIMAIPRPPSLPSGHLGAISTTATSVLEKEPDQISRNGSIKDKVGGDAHGFRLLEKTMPNNDETGSVYSIYKQKIDAMFESDSSSSKNSVQAKIEKMFCEVAKDSGIIMTEYGVHSFSVDYLGSVPLQDKVTSLAGLQSPLRDLYFAYKKMSASRKVYTGRLEISHQGLKVLYQGEKGDLEQLNSFPTIAVWSAVKFVVNEKPNTSYAFLPLITDPDNMDKKTLFRSLGENEKKYISRDSHHSPLFAVVMRKIGVQKQLECHGFVCQTSEDAIVIAATLYKSLVAHMKAKERKPRNKNGVTTCLSITSSLNNEKNNNSIPVRPPRKKRSSTSSVISETDVISISDTKPLLEAEMKSPRKSSKTKRAPKAPELKNSDINAILPYEEPTKSSDMEKWSNVNGDKNKSELIEKSDEITEIKPKKLTEKLNTSMSQEQKQLTAEIKQMMSEGGKCLRKVQNLRKQDEPVIKKEHTGDILTKVTIPRSGSFLNAGGLTRYKNKVSRNNEQSSNGSPLGFKEIFNELSLQEGLHSLDDILGVIIDPQGMSFNDLKPIYKEFLLKLSLTLTKDELYQKAKMIMRKQKKKVLNKNQNPTQKRNPHMLVGGKFRKLKHIFQRSFKNKFGQPFLSPSSRKIPEISQKQTMKLGESSISTSSYDTRQFRPKENLARNKKYNYKKKTGDFTRKDRTSTSEDSDFLSVHRNKIKNHSFPTIHTQNRNSSSGYVSCSECSYDSDTCTCTSADRCYCSLGQRNCSKSKKRSSCYCAQDVTFCECDTDSCAESNKCYCQNAVHNARIFEELRKANIIENQSIKHKKLAKTNSNTKSTKSLEYILNPSESYYEKYKSNSRYVSKNSIPTMNLERNAAEYDLMNSTNNKLGYSRRSFHGGDYCGNVTGFEPCRPLSAKTYGSIRSHHSSSRTVKSAALTSDTCSEALSVKKSAEIAALFADVKLSQTTDITHLAPRNFDTTAMVSSRNSYNKLHSQQTKPPKSTKSGSSRAESKHNEHIGHPPKNASSLYRNVNLSKNGANSVRSRTRNGSASVRSNRNKMYSAKNGLYTIQSQSDESRRSSVNEGRKFIDNRDYYNSDLQIDNMSNKLEDSLGYLP